MIEIKRYRLLPTSLIPNSPRPLLHYRGVLQGSDDISTGAYDLFTKNGWEPQWITRYGDTQPSHYHSGTHECMAVLHGNAIIRFGVGDTVSDMDQNTYGNGKESGGVELEAQVGDVFVIPAGVAHKTYKTELAALFEFLTPGDGHSIEAADPRKVVQDTKLSGLIMIGAYPVGGRWDWAFGEHSNGNYEEVWSVIKPPMDPVLGTAAEGLVGQWH